MDTRHAVEMEGFYEIVVLRGKIQCNGQWRKLLIVGRVTSLHLYCWTFYMLTSVVTSVAVIYDSSMYLFTTQHDL